MGIHIKQVGIDYSFTSDWPKQRHLLEALNANNTFYNSLDPNRNIITIDAGFLPSKTAESSQHSKNSQHTSAS